MNKIIAVIVAAVVAMFAFAGTAFGQTVVGDVSPEDPGFYAQFQMMYKVRDAKGEEADLWVKQVYVEKQVAEKFSVFASTYHDKEFISVLVGPAYKWGDLQIGVGLGGARYGSVSRAMMNPWVYYTHEKWEAFVSYEHYGKEKVDPSFWKGSLKYKLTEKFFLGIYGETLYGVGPVVGAKFDHFTFSVTHRKGSTFLTVSYEIEE